MLLFASALKNPNQAPIEAACVWIEGDTIRFAGPRSECPAEASNDLEQRDLGDVVLSPGLVNAHAHLELTSMNKLSYPGSFVAWIREVLAAKNQLPPEAQERAMPRGIMLSLVSGVTTIGDHISVTGDLESLLYSPLRGKVFIEILGVVPEVAQDIHDAALSLKKAYEKFPSLIEVIPSPHSIHALVPEVLEQIFQQDQKLFSIHLAESEAEQAYFQKKAGPLFDLIAERGKALPRQTGSAVQELLDRGLLDSRILAIHGNYLNDTEIDLLAQRRISVVHCPLSHRYFSHQAFPMKTHLEKGTNIALGTDSLASSSSLSMFEVMRETARTFPELGEEKIFAMATLGGARALKLEGVVGEIAAGKKADIIGVSRPGQLSPMHAIFYSKRVCFSMIGGKIILG
jgi:cytosine/adenosine deaminase-related metal-dependent hydrolase